MKSLLLALPFLLTLTTARTIHIRQTADNLQSFTGDLGAAALPITFSGDTTRPFLVNGNTFVNFAAAAQRTCDVQFNKCADTANGGAAFSVSDCQGQKDACDAAQTAATVKTFDATATAAATTAAAPVATGIGTAAPAGVCVAARKVKREVRF